MNYEQALETQKHNPKGVMKVLEGLERECPDCQPHNENNWRFCTCKTCGESGKLHYSWTPQMGEWVVYKKDVALVVRYWPKTASNKYESIEVSFKGQWEEDRFGTLGIEEMISEFTPILEWEEIERVLEKAGYKVDVAKSIGGAFFCSVTSQGEHLFTIYRPTRTEAVYDAVLELGKEMK